MDQTEFKRALAKFNRQKQKRAEAVLNEGRVHPSSALPFDVITEPKPKVKIIEAPRPRPQAMEITVSGPVDLQFSIDWAGALLGGQMNPQAMKVMFLKHLQPFGRVTAK